LIQEIGKREGGVGLQEVELVLLSACSADRPRSPCKLSVRCGSAGCFSCLSRVLERSLFDLLCQLFLVGKGFADRPPGHRGPSAQHKLLADRPRIGRGLFIFQGAVLEVLLQFSDRPP
jgi:hypothetical protein